MTETFFTGDTHFDHKGMLRFRTQFGIDVDNASPDELEQGLEAMNEHLVQAWNARIGRRDVVWHLGDFSFGPAERNAAIFKRLNGVKHLVLGNHDPNRIAALPWASVQDLKALNVDGHGFELLHYPMLTWRGSHKGRWHLHGHSHGNLAPGSTRLDVGVDTRADLGPYHLSEVVEILSAASYETVDHHG